MHQFRPFSACAIRIFDLAGNVLYQVWHDGAIFGFAWLPASRLLVMSTLNSEHSWSTRGVGSMASYPAAIFAVRPEAGHLNTRSWIVSNNRRHDTTLRWYRWLGPPEHLTSFQTLVPIAAEWAGRATPEERVTVRFEERETATDIRTINVFAISLNADGQEVSRFIGEGYRTSVTQGQIPDDRVLRLLDYEDLPAPFSSLAEEP